MEKDQSLLTHVPTAEKSPLKESTKRKKEEAKYPCDSKDRKVPFYCFVSLYEISQTSFSKASFC